MRFSFIYFLTYYERICLIKYIFFSKFDFRESRWKKLKQRLVKQYMSNFKLSIHYYIVWSEYKLNVFFKELQEMAPFFNVFTLWRNIFPHCDAEKRSCDVRFIYLTLVSRIKYVQSCEKRSICKNTNKLQPCHIHTCVAIFSLTIHIDSWLFQ